MRNLMSDDECHSFRHSFMHTGQNQIERCYNKLKNARPVVTRYDKTILSFIGFVQITSIRFG